MRISASKVLPHAYHGREDLKEVILEDQVEEIGEGAFFHCTSLRQIYVGKRVEKVGADAFSQISRNADFVWLGKASYRSMLVRLLPPFTRVKGICAPFTSFRKAKEEEKLVLAIGFILHPEYEDLYETELKKEYLSYIRTQLPLHPAQLCEKDAMYEVLCGLWERRLLSGATKEPEKETDVIRQFLSYARSTKTSREEKLRLDQIEREAGLLNQKESVFSGQYERDKHLLRLIREQVSDDALRSTMESLGLNEFPDICYRDSKEAAPAEAWKYIIYCYVSQWNPAGPIPAFERVPSADALAQQLELKGLKPGLKPDGMAYWPYARQESLKDVLSQYLCPCVEETDGRKTVLYSRRLIPFLRFAEEEGIRQCAALWEEWKNYDCYGQSGYQAGKVIEQAMLLSDCLEARIFFARIGRLAAYAAHWKKDEDALFWEAFLWLEKNERPEFRDLLIQYQSRFYESYLDGKKLRFDVFSGTRLASPTVRQLLKQFVFQAKKAGCFSVCDEGFADERGNLLTMEEDDEICVAYPSELTDTQLIRWKSHIPLCGLQVPGKAGRKAEKLPYSDRLRRKREGSLSGEDTPAPWFVQLHDIDRSCMPDNFGLCQNRYKDIRVPVQAILSLADRGMQTEGQISGRIRISFHKKVILYAQADTKESMLAGIQTRDQTEETIHPSERIRDRTDRTMRLGELIQADYTQRELHELLYLLDEAFCYEMLLEGRLEVQPYLKCFDQKQLETILEASISAGKHENVAILLEYLKKLRQREMAQYSCERQEQEDIFDADEELDW